VPTERDFYETYLPQFEAAVREGHVGAVMGAYNSRLWRAGLREPAAAHRAAAPAMGFDGHVVSDCGAIYDIWANHKVVATPEEAPRAP
jgi:beta-glucosidase